MGLAAVELVVSIAGMVRPVDCVQYVYIHVYGTDLSLRHRNPPLDVLSWQSVLPSWVLLLQVWRVGGLGFATCRGGGRWGPLVL